MSVPSGSDLLLPRTLSAGDNSLKAASTAYVDRAVAAGGGVSAADFNRLQQNVLYEGLLEAALRGVPQGLVDGVIDPFSTTADVNASKSSGYTFSSSAGTIGATVTPGTATTVSTSAQAISNGSYDGTSGRTADKPFASSPSNWASPQNTTNTSPPTAYIGQDFGAGNTQAIAQVLFTQNGDSYSVSSVLAQVADSPSGPWTTVQTIAVSATSTTQQTLSISSPQARRCFRLLANSGVSNSQALWIVAALQFQTISPASAAAMVLQSATLASAVASPSAARVLIQVDPSSAAFTPNTDLIASFSRDGGTTFTQGTLSAVGTMPDGTAVYDTGYFSVSGQPIGNSTMTYKLTTPTQKAIVLTGIAMQVKP